MEIQITPKNTTGVERAVEVSVPAAEIIAAEEKTTRRYASSIRLPGFRVGKAPAAIVKKRFADEIRNEAIESVVREAYKEIIEKNDVKVVSQPHVHALKFEEGQPLTFEFHYEVGPDIVLAKTDGFKVEKKKNELTEEQVQEQLQTLRDERATWSPIEDKPLEGDMVKVSLAIADESGAFGAAQEVPFVLGDGKAIAAIEELITEATPGQTVERPVKWPEDFPDESQRGVSKTVRMTLLEAKRKTLPELDDAFARELGDFDSVGALVTAVRDDMTNYIEREADASVRGSLINEIIAANPFDVPKTWVARMLQQYAEMYGIPNEQREQFDAEFRNIAEGQIKRDLVIEKIAEEQKLTASEKEIDDKITEQATARQVPPGELYAAFEKAGRLKELEMSITQDKVFDWLMERNEIV